MSSSHSGSSAGKGEDGSQIERLSIQEEEFRLEQEQLVRAEEIRIALLRRDETIARLQDRLTIASSTIEKYKAKTRKLLGDLDQRETDNEELTRALILTQQELQVVQGNEKQLMKENLRLENLVSQLKDSNHNAHLLREGLKRAEENEQRLRLENSVLVKRYEEEATRLKANLIDEIEVLKSTKTDQQKRIVLLEKSLEDQRAKLSETDLGLKEARLLAADSERRIKDEIRRASEFEQRFHSETKRVALFECKYRDELERANQAEQVLGHERAQFKADIGRLQLEVIALQEKIEAQEAERTVSDNAWKEKLDNVSKELKQKNARVFDLENQLNGALFVAERKLTKVERAADSRVATAVKEAAEAHRIVADKERRASQVLETHKSLIYNLELQKERQYRANALSTWLFSSIDCFLSLLGAIEGSSNDDKKGRIRAIGKFKSVVWSIVFCFSFRKKRPGSRTILGSTSWSAPVIFSRAVNTLDLRITSAIIAIENILPMSVQLRDAQSGIERLKNELEKNRAYCNELEIRNSFLDATLRELKIKYKELQKEMAHSRHREQQSSQHLFKLQEIIAILERENLVSNQALAKCNIEWEAKTMDLETLAKRFAQRAKQLQVELGTERQLQTARLEHIRILEIERDDARAEAAAAREMVERTEKYAEAEIHSLTNMLTNDPTM